MERGHCRGGDQGQHHRQKHAVQNRHQHLDAASEHVPRGGLDQQLYEHHERGRAKDTELVEELLQVIFLWL